jgi:hypothetical protein
MALKIKISKLMKKPQEKTPKGKSRPWNPFLMRKSRIPGEENHWQP